MADRFDQALALVNDAEKRLAEVQRVYEESLHAQTVSVELQIRMKGVLEGLRSALDYCARELRSRYVSGGGSGNVYFPIAPRGFAEDFKSFVEKRKIPGLPKVRPDLVSVLESYQEFASPTNEWLPDLASLCNENKHEQLTPQKREESERIRVEFQCGCVSWKPECTRFGSDVRIGAVPVDPSTQLPTPSDAQTVTREVWVSFEFTTVGRPVIPFLATCVDGVKAIVNDLRVKAK